MSTVSAISLKPTAKKGITILLTLLFSYALGSSTAWSQGSQSRNNQVQRDQRQVDQSQSDRSQSAQPRLVIVTENGHVRLQDHDSGLTESELRSLETYVENKLAETPFRYGGTVQLTLKEDTLRQLSQELKENGDSRDMRAVDQALNDVWRRTTPDAADDVTSLPTKLIIGQNFSLPANQTFGDIVAIGSTGTIDATVDGLITIGSDISLGDNARVLESYVEIGSQVERAPGARIEGEEVTITLPSDISSWSGYFTPYVEPMANRPGVRIFWWVSTLLTSLLFGFAYIFLFPRFHDQSVRYSREHAGWGFIFGFLGYASIAPLLFLLVITLIGIALIPVVIMIYTVLVVIGHVTIATRIGRLLGEKRAWNDYMTFAIGLIVMRIVGLLPLLGGLFVVIVTTIGFGAALHTLFATIRARRTSAPTLPPTETREPPPRTPQFSPA